MALLKFKRSAVPAKIPSIADLDLGELAINTYDGKVYTKKDDGTQSIVEVGGTASTTNTILLPVRNNTGATLTKGTAVYINGALGQNPTVTKAIATSDATSAQTLGLVSIDLPNNTVGNVTLIGSLDDVDTSAYTDGAQLYLSPTTAGALTATKPYAPNHLVYIAVVEYAHPALGKLFVKVQNGYEMDELHNVAAQSPANNDGLFYNTSTSLWEKKSIATALGYTPANKAGDTFTGGVYSAGQIRAAGWWGDVSASATGLGVEIGESGGRSYVISYSRDVAAYGPMSFEATDFTFTGVSGGFIGANTSVRAPIFYDSNDTAYYVDPTSLSRLNAVQGTYFGASDGYNQPTLFRVSAGDDNWAYGSYADGGAQYWMQTQFYGMGDDNRGFRVLDKNGGVVRFRVNGAGSAIASGDVRAPVFYDTDNTAYYVDPASGSNLTGQVQINGGTIMSGGWNRALYLASQFPVIVMNSGSVKYSGIGVDYSEAQSGMVFWVNGNSADITNGSATAALRINTGNYVVANDFRAAIFYDTNNSAYFLDPASTSNLGGVQLNGTLDVRNGAAQFLRSANGAYQRVDGRDEAATLSRAHWYGVDSSGGTSNFRHAWYDGSQYFNVSAGSGQVSFERLGGGGSVYSAGDFRAPIFYDSNDTGYYLDPHDTSFTNGMRANVYRSLYSGGQPAARWDTSFYVLQSQHWYSHTGAMTMYVGESGDFVYIRGYTTAEGSSRSPVFYDSNDTSYYVDPATAGLSLRVNGNIECYARSAAWSEGLRVRVPTRATWGGIRFTRDEGNANGNWAIGFTGIDSTDDLTFWGNLSGAEGMRARLTQTGIFSTTGELRTSGQITNSNYMVGGSQSGAVNIGRNDLNYRWEGTAWGSTTTLGLLANCLDYWEMGIHDSGSKVISPLYYDGGARFLMGRDIGWGQTYVEAASSFRAPVFYDSNDTNYYIDAASNSVLNTLTLGGRATTSVMYYQGFTLDANTMDTNATGFTYGVNAPFVGPIIRAGESGYSLQLNAPYGGGGRFAFRTRNGDTGSFNSWQYPALYDQNVNGGGALYASIYYDQNNTVYYLNPESTSVLWEAATYYLRNIEDVAVNHEYGLYFSNSRSTAYAIYREAGAWTHPYPDLRIAFHTGIKMGAAAGYGGMKFYTDYDMSSQVMSINNGADGVGGGNVFVNNVLVAAGDIRSQIFYDYNNTGYYLDASSTGTSLNVAGSIVAAGNVTAYSDIRIKANVETIPSALDKLDQIRGVTYTRTDLDDKEQRYAGVIAQEIEAVLPEAVRDLGNIKAVDYNATIALLIQAVKELRDEVEALRK